MPRYLPRVATLLTALALVALTLPGTQAARVKVWHHHSPAHFDKAQFKHAIVSSEGALQLARELKPLAQLDAMHVWDVVEDKQGNLFVATGDEGKIYKIPPGGKASVVYTSTDSQILSLAVGPDGSVYAGTHKGGLVYRIDTHGKGFVLYSTGQSEVRSLLVSADGIYAGTSAPVKRRPGGGGPGSPTPAGSTSALNAKDGVSPAIEKPKD